MIVPIVIPISTLMIPTYIEIRAPAITRLKTSRPRSSEPSQAMEEGATKGA